MKRGLAHIKPETWRDCKYKNTILLDKYELKGRNKTAGDKKIIGIKLATKERQEKEKEITRYKKAR